MLCKGWLSRFSFMFSMLSWVKWGVRAVAPVVALGGMAHGFSVEALPTHGVFYAGLQAQPCLRVKVTADAGEKLTQLSFSTSGSSKNAIAAAWLYRSSTPFFSLHAEGDAAAQKLGKLSGAGKFVSKSGGVSLQAGANYFWLVYDLAPTAKGGGKVCGRLKSATDGKGAELSPAKGLDGSKRADGKTAATPGEIFPYKYRIAPYVRPTFACAFNQKMFTPEHMKGMTDWIVFGYTHEGPRITAAHDALLRGKDLAPACLELARSLRGKDKGVRILAGFSCNERKNPLCGVMHDAEKRRTLARHLAELVLSNGYDGVDIDWEYPRENSRFKPRASWRKFALFLAELREELAGSGASISIAVTTRYDAPNVEVFDGVDFINSMSYGRPGKHSTLEDAAVDVAFLLERKTPPVKIVLGLPFFSRDTHAKHDDNGGCTYSSIVSMFPGLSPSQNTFRHPESGAEHFFNGASLIKTKCESFVLRKGIGGVCIWAYDTDVPISHPKSLSKALYSVISRKGSSKKSSE